MRYYEGLEKLGMKPRFRFIKADIGDRQFRLIASANVPVFVGIYIKNVLVSVRSSINLTTQALSSFDVLVSLPNKPYQNNQNETRYDEHVAFDSRDLR